MSFVWHISVIRSIFYILLFIDRKKTFLWSSISMFKYSKSYVWIYFIASIFCSPRFKPKSVYSVVRSRKHRNSYRLDYFTEKMCKIVLIHCLIYFLMLLISDIKMITIERNEKHVFNATPHQQLLSRRRRYLTFPEGSSLQLGLFNSIFQI